MNRNINQNFLQNSSINLKKSEILDNINFFKLSWPITIEHLLYLCIVFIDALILASISNEAAAGVGACSFIITFGLVFVIGFGQGASVCISHRLGKLQFLQAQSLTRAAIYSVMCLGLFLGLLQLLLHKQIPEWLGLTGAVQNNASIFLLVVGSTIIFQSIIIILSFILRAYGHPKQPMYVALLVNIINVILSYSVTHGFFGLPVMGVEGVAWSTVIARFIGMMIIGYFVFKNLNFIYHFKNISKDLQHHLKPILKYGIPSCLEPLSYQGSQIIITRIIAMIGAEALALRTYVWSIASFNSVFAFGFAQATQIIVGRLYGASLYEDAKNEFQSNLKFSLFCTLSIVTLTWILSKFILSLFLDDPALISMGSTLLAMGYVFDVGRTTNIMTVSALRSVGEPIFPLYTGLIFMWGLSIPIAWFFGIYLGYGLLGVWLGLALDEFIRGLTNLYHFYSEKWKLKQLDRGLDPVSP